MDLPRPARKTATSLIELCQTDIVIEGGDAQLAVEIKSKSKSSRDQVLKYAALISLRTRRVPDRDIRKLVLVAPCETFAHLWKGKAYADVNSLRTACVNMTMPILIASSAGLAFRCDRQ